MRRIVCAIVVVVLAGCSLGPPRRQATAAPLLSPEAAAVVPHANLNVYFGNLHSHTSYSDGSGTPDEAYTYARNTAKVDFLAITEHNHRGAPSQLQDNPDLYSGATPDSLISAATRHDKPGQFAAIYGQEFSSISRGNHANVFQLNEVIDAGQVPNGDYGELLTNWLRTHKDSFGKPALMLLNHPAQSSSNNAEEYGIDDFDDADAWRTALQKHAALINIINGPSHEVGDPPGRPSESEYIRYLNLGLRVGPTADQDNHKKNWGNAAKTRTGVLAPRLSVEAIIDALRARHVYATQDSTLSIKAFIAGELMGGAIPVSEAPEVGEAIEIRLILKDPDEPNARYDIDVYSDAVGGAVGRIESWAIAQGDGEWIIEGPAYEGPGQHVFLRITQSSRDRAWTAPVWFGAN